MSGRLVRIHHDNISISIMIRRSFPISRCNDNREPFDQSSATIDILNKVVHSIGTAILCFYSIVRIYLKHTKLRLLFSEEFDLMNVVIPTTSRC